MDCTAGHGSNWLGEATKVSVTGSRLGVRRRLCEPYPGDGHSGSADRGPLTLAERILRAGDRFDPTGLFGPRDRLGRAPPSPSAALLCELVQSEPNTPVLEQGCADEAASSHPREHRSPARPRRPAYLISDRTIIKHGPPATETSA